MAGALWFSLTSTIFLLFYGCSKLGVWADCCSLAKLSLNTNNGIFSDTLCGLLSTLSLPTSLVMDLNGTFFINNILIETATESYDSIDVDIGTTSCGSFHDNACYITCSVRHVVQNSACYVTMNVTCNVDNVKGRYVRIRQSNASALVLCDVNVTGWPDSDKVLKNVALNAQCSQCATYYNWIPGRAVDGNRTGTKAGQSCSHTDVTNENNTEHIHWWQVDLNKLILVSHIIIANRVDSCCIERLANFTVELGHLELSGNITYTLCCYHDGVAGPLTTLNCTRSIWGQFVRISLMGVALTLCEVEVYGDTVDKQLLPVMPLIPTDFSCDPLITSLTTPKTTTAAATSSMPPTEATIFEMISENTSEAKVSTENLQVSSEAKVSTVHPEAMTDAKPSTEQNFNFEIPWKHNCMCSCWNALSKKSPEEVQEQMLQTAKELKMKSSDLGQQIRKKSSLPDRRLSSTVVGVVCGIVMSSIFGAIILCDICRLCHYFGRRKYNT